MVDAIVFIAQESLDLYKVSFGNPTLNFYLKLSRPISGENASEAFQALLQITPNPKKKTSGRIQIMHWETKA